MTVTTHTPDVTAAVAAAAAHVDALAAARGLTLLAAADNGVAVRIYADVDLDSGELYFVTDDATDEFGINPAFKLHVSDEIACLNRDSRLQLHAALAVIGDVDPVAATALRIAMAPYAAVGLLDGVSFADYDSFAFTSEFDGVLQSLEYDSRFVSDETVRFLEAYRFVPTGDIVYRVGHYCSCCGRDQIETIGELTVGSLEEARAKFDRTY